MYIVVNKVKRKALSLGFRTDKSFVHVLDVLMDRMIERVALDWTRPKKTITGEELSAYLAHHHITL